MMSPSGDSRFVNSKSTQSLKSHASQAKSHFLKLKINKSPNKNYLSLFFKVYSNKGGGHKNLSGVFTGEGMLRFKKKSMF